jgi:hypothetical protein
VCFDGSSPNSAVLDACFLLVAYFTYSAIMKFRNVGEAPTTLRHVQGHMYSHSHRCENIKSNVIKFDRIFLAVVRKISSRGLPPYCDPESYATGSVSHPYQTGQNVGAGYMSLVLQVAGLSVGLLIPLLKNVLLRNSGGGQDPHWIVAPVKNREVCKTPEVLCNANTQL